MPSPSPSIDDIALDIDERTAFAKALAIAFPSELEADPILSGVGFERHRRPSFQAANALAVWHRILDELDRGIVEAPFRRLLAAALDAYPFNPTFRSLAAAHGFPRPAATEGRAPASPPSSPPPQATPDQRGKVFLCHSSGDKEVVRALYRRLVADGQDPWLDEEDLLGGQTWELEIRRAIRASRAVVVCLSKESIGKRGFVNREIVFALDVADEQPEGAVFVIPVRLEPCELPDRLRRWHAVDYYDERGYGRLLRTLTA